MLSLERLRTLHTVAAYGSVQAAADVLRVSTSAVSQQLAKLERDVGQQLLERQGRGVRLTEAAGLLVAHATRIFSAVEAAQAELEAHHDAVVGQLTVAAFPTAARGLLPAALRELSERFPALTIELSEMDPEVSIPLVNRGDIDLAVSQDWRNAPLALPAALEKQALFDDGADVIVPTGHWAGPTVTLRELANEQWIASPRGAICHDWLVYTLRSSDVEPKIAHTSAEYATQLALVAAGLGLAVIPRLGRETLPPGVRVVAVQPALERHVYAMWRRDATRRPAIRAIIAALANNIPKA